MLPPRIHRFIALARLTAFAGCATSHAGPSAATSPASYYYACRSWRPAPPTTKRVVADILLRGDTATPSPEAVAALVRSHGGQVVRSYHVAMVRAEIDVTEVPNVGDVAWTTTESAPLMVGLMAMFDRDPTDADSAWLVGGGAQLRRVWRGAERHAFRGFAGTVPDSLVPEVRGMPGFRFLSVDASGKVCAD